MKLDKQISFRTQLYLEFRNQINCQLHWLVISQVYKHFFVLNSSFDEQLGLQLYWQLKEEIDKGGLK